MSDTPQNTAPPESVPRSAPVPEAGSDSTEATNSRDIDSQENVAPPTEPAATEPVREDALTPAPVELADGGSSGTPPESASSGDDGDDDPDEGSMTKMSFLEHLEELRQRLINSLIAIACGFGACFWFSQFIFERLIEPIKQAQRALKLTEGVNFTSPSDPINIFLQIGLICGLFAASPFVMYQVWAFISPGLYKHEKKYAVPFVVVCSGLFMAGGAFGYFVAFPYALQFLLGLGTADFRPVIMAREYLDLFTTIIIGLGIVFELPVLILILSALRVVTPGFLLRNFRYAVLVITIVAAVVTPTTDPLNMMLFALPMMALYLLGVFFAWLVTRGRTQQDA